MNLFNFFNFFSHTHNKKLQVDAALCTRIAENGADAQPCLSDVYKNGTRARRRQADVPLYAISSGRSMVEMLGVLAIIGVLSVGAIAGYSKAMMKYKLNKQAEQLSTLINAGLRYAGQWKFESATATTPYFIKLGEIPNEMIKNNVIYDVFNSKISFRYTFWESNKPCTAIYINYDNTVDNHQLLDICRNMVTVAKEFYEDIAYIVIISRENENSPYDGITYYGNKYYKTTSTNRLKDMTVSDIDAFCRYNIGKNQGDFKIAWPE